jgi:UDP-N-acetylmuramate--alanine ligase
MFDTNRRIHFVGIGGAGMSGIAEVLLNLGYPVSGSDTKDSDTTKRLRTLGASIHIGHSASAVANADVVVASSAINKNNPEIQEAQNKRIPVIHRSEMLAELMRLKHGIIVAGTHGKTTTTSLMATVLGAAGIDPTVVIGGRLNAYGTNAKLGKSDFFLAEADESDGSFLRLTPSIAVITNIDKDHLDHWSGFDEIVSAFRDFLEKTPFYGCICACIDDPGVQLVVPHIRRRIVSYGLRPDADITARDIEQSGFESSFTPVVFGVAQARVTLKMPGRHNIQNALASFAVAHALKTDLGAVSKALSAFEGVLHRTTLLGEAANSIVIDDYAHNPQKIAAALRGLREGFREAHLCAIFQPHRYTRIKSMLEDFSRCFSDADSVIVTPIYSAGESPIAGITPEGMAQHIQKGSFGGSTNSVKVVQNLQEAALAAADIAKRNTDSKTVIVSLGAGDVANVGEWILRHLRGEK